MTEKQYPRLGQITIPGLEPEEAQICEAGSKNKCAHANMTKRISTVELLFERALAAGLTLDEIGEIDESSVGATAREPERGDFNSEPAIRVRAKTTTGLRFILKGDSPAHRTYMRLNDTDLAELAATTQSGPPPMLTYDVELDRGSHSPRVMTPNGVTLTPQQEKLIDNVRRKAMKQSTRKAAYAVAEADSRYMEAAPEVQEAIQERIISALNRREEAQVKEALTVTPKPKRRAPRPERRYHTDKD